MFISFMLRPLSQLMKIKHACVYFRMLADDLLLMYVGDQVTVLAAAFDDVHMFLHALGSKIAPKKCFTFSSHAILGPG